MCVCVCVCVCVGYSTTLSPCQMEQQCSAVSTVTLSALQTNVHTRWDQHRQVTLFTTSLSLSLSLTHTPHTHHTHTCTHTHTHVHTHTHAHTPHTSTHEHTHTPHTSTLISSSFTPLSLPLWLHEDKSRADFTVPPPREIKRGAARRGSGGHEKHMPAAARGPLNPYRSTGPQAPGPRPQAPAR